MKVSKRMAMVIVFGLVVIGAGCNSKGSSQAPAKSPLAAETPKSLVSREPTQNASPLGLEIGFANVQGVKEKIGAVTSLKDTGMNQYSGGLMFVSNGQGLGIEGLSSAQFIFDSNNILVGVILSLPKDAKGMLESLSGKYQVVDNKIDNFMNYGYALLGKGDSLVEIDSPHMSFAMEIRYLTKKLLADFKQQSSNQETQKKKDQLNKM